jgi:hypothetical protein
VGERVLSKLESDGGIASKVIVNIGGEVEVRDINELNDASRKVLLDVKRYKSNPQYNKALFAKVQKSVPDQLSRLSYLNSIHNGAKMSVGDVLVNKHLRALFREKALISSKYIATTLTGKPEPQELKPASKHLGFRVGNSVIKFGFSHNRVIMLPRRSGDVYTVMDGPNVLQKLPQRWHPYYALPRHFRLVMGLFGVTPSAHSQIKIKTFMNKFSPGHFRSDLTAEEVVNALKRTKTKEDQIALLEHIGFTTDEISSMLHHVKDIPLYEDFSAADEFSSVPDIVKSCSPYVAEQLLFHAAQHHYASLFNPETKRIVLSHFVSLIVDEMNMACSLHSPNSRVQAFIRLPTVELSTLT